jgi:hypothetical protein
MSHGVAAETGVRSEEVQEDTTGPTRAAAAVEAHPVSDLEEEEEEAVEVAEEGGPVAVADVDSADRTRVSL